MYPRCCAKSCLICNCPGLALAGSGTCKSSQGKVESQLNEWPSFTYTDLRAGPQPQVVCGSPDFSPEIDSIVPTLFGEPCHWVPLAHGINQTELFFANQVKSKKLSSLLFYQSKIWLQKGSHNRIKYFACLPKVTFPSFFLISVNVSTKRSETLRGTLGSKASSIWQLLCTYAVVYFFCFTHLPSIQQGGRARNRV